MTRTADGLGFRVAISSPLLAGYGESETLRYGITSDGPWALIPDSQHNAAVRVSGLCRFAEVDAERVEKAAGIGGLSENRPTDDLLRVHLVFFSRANASDLTATS